MPFPAIDLDQVQTYSLSSRPSLVELNDLLMPGDPPPVFDKTELNEIAGRIASARQKGAPVIWSIGGHVVKRGLAPLLIDLVKRRVITHLASNGAAAIHDFEIALMGYTSEDVANSLENGSFGMAEETGGMMNRAIRQGVPRGMGMGEALGEWIASDPRFKFREYSLLYNAYAAGIPYTVHSAIGTDIIHQHPLCDFAALGWATGQDFKIYCTSVSKLEGGVFCNFGSAVIGPEVFLKALSIVRNLGHTVKVLTTANFDLIDLPGDYRKPSTDDQTDYYYRPKKNIVIRPNSLGGRGYHIPGDHRDTIPSLYYQVCNLLAGSSLPLPPVIRQESLMAESASIEILRQRYTAASRVMSNTLVENPAWKQTAGVIASAFIAIKSRLEIAGTLFYCADKYLPGQLEYDRPIPKAHVDRMIGMEGGEKLASLLKPGLRVIQLSSRGLQPSNRHILSSSSPQSSAQTLYTLARAGDVYLAFDPSGESDDIYETTLTALALGLPVVALTANKKSRLARVAEINICPELEINDPESILGKYLHLLFELLLAEAHRDL